MRWVVLFLFLLLAPVCAETPGNDIRVPGPDGFVLHPILSEPDPKAGNSRSVLRIDITREGQPFQSLHPQLNSPPLDPDHPLDLSHSIRCDDCNFDGHPDIVFVDSLGMGTNTSNQVWLYDQRAQRFVWSSDLSNLSGLEVYPDRRRLKSVSRNEAGLAAESETFEWHHGSLVLVEERIQEPVSDWSRNPVKVRCVVRKRVHGRMQVAEETLFLLDGKQTVLSHHIYL